MALSAEQKTRIEKRFLFRDIHPDEARQAGEIEQICFPPNEACRMDQMISRAQSAPELFLVAIDRQDGKMAGFLNGLSTKEHIFRDEFFTDVSLYDPDGTDVMLLGLDVLPQYRRQGLATAIVAEYRRREKAKGRQRLVLTCLADKVPMYEGMGFRNLGISGSVWGGEQWFDMDFLL